MKKTYNALVCCCCEKGEYREAKKMTEAMIKHGHLPRLESSKLLICGLYDQEDEEEAEHFFRSLLVCGYNHDELAWKLLVDGLLKKGFVKRCSDLLQVMERKGCQLHPQTYTLLIEGLDGM